MKVKKLILCALFSALSVILSQISLPIGPVPINLVHISIFLAAKALGANYGAFSQLIFVSMGLIGMPVFSSFSGGLVVLAGPTGGFILSFVGCAWISGKLMEKPNSSTFQTIFAMVMGLIFSYILGSLWFMMIMETNLITTLSISVFPFLIGDIIKIAISFSLIKRINWLLINKV